MFGVSFLEIALVGLVALVVVGPQKLPGMMRTAGEWVGKLRRMTSDMRAQTGIDDILREEGIDGVAELRTLLRGQFSHQQASRHSAYDPYPQEPDPLLEFPVEGVDSAGALPDDLVNRGSADASQSAAPTGAEPSVAPTDAEPSAAPAEPLPAER